jgi:hypothetical protein
VRRKRLTIALLVSNNGHLSLFQGYLALMLPIEAMPTVRIALGIAGIESMLQGQPAQVRGAAAGEGQVRT